jgi:hypothetical protein
MGAVVACGADVGEFPDGAAVGLVAAGVAVAEAPQATAISVTRAPPMMTTLLFQNFGLKFFQGFTIVPTPYEFLPADPDKFPSSALQTDWNSSDLEQPDSGIERCRGSRVSSQIHPWRGFCIRRT